MICGISMFGLFCMLSSLNITVTIISHLEAQCHMSFKLYYNWGRFLLKALTSLLKFIWPGYVKIVNNVMTYTMMGKYTKPKKYHIYIYIINFLLVISYVETW